MTRLLLVLTIALGVAGRPHFYPHNITGSTYLGSLAIIHGCFGGYPTQSVSLEFPDLGADIPILWVLPQYMPDWNITIESRTLAKPFVSDWHDNFSTNTTVSKITWTPTDDGPIPDNNMGLFGIRFTLFNGTSGMKIPFVVTQVCPGAPPMVWNGLDETHHQPKITVA